MAFVSPSSPLPYNSAVPGPPVIDTDYVNMVANASRTGRERVYANVPTAASLFHLGGGLAVDANQILQQSEQSRQAVLIGLAPATSYLADDASLAEIQANAPVVSSLQGSPGDVATFSGESGLMPAPAPHLTYGGIWASPKLPGGGTGSGQLGVNTIVTRPSKHFLKTTDKLGPGCTLTFTKGAGLRPPAPPWGDAGMLQMPTSGAMSGGGMVWLGLGAVAVLALLAKKKGRR